MIDLERVKGLKVLLMGDAIMDEYIYVTTVGKAIKENALSSIFKRREQFKGGVWAAALHTLGFCDRVDVMTGPDVMWNSRLVDDIYLRKLSVMHELKKESATRQDYDIGDYDLVIVTDFGHG